ncbi:MAG: primosomal protein N' [Rhodobacteraceae bacterium]|nr:primosomal protein N' [Paracoccaceae bacterium]
MTQEYFAEGTLIGVLTTEPLDRVLDYKAPAGGCKPGAFVQVPLGPRKVPGVVWGPGRGDWDASKLRTVRRVLDLPPMRRELRDFLERAGAYTLTPLPAMLRLATRAPGLRDLPSTRTIYRLGQGRGARMTDARRRVLAVLQEDGGPGLTLGEVSERAGVTPSVTRGLVASGAVEQVAAPCVAPYPPLDPDRPGKTLTAEQAQAAETLCRAVRDDGYGTTLLKGVTGAGKTEVYLEAIAACLRKGRQALVLLPEIALTAGFLNRVDQRFGAKPAEWHSGVTLPARHRCWRMVGQGQAQLVVGARSALFLPFRDLGLIVVDEEHDTSYKQEDGVLYHARDMAVLRASCNAAHVILASATPSLETWANVQAGKYARLDLTARFGGATLPQLRAIDMRQEDVPPNTWISPALEQAVRQRIGDGEQALLFLNRRGYAPVTLCRACGAQVSCHSCDARMVEHRLQRRLLCHQCGATRPVPVACPSCGAQGRMAAVGPGVERLAEEAARLFPTARQAVLSSDLFRSARALKAQIKAITDGDADLIIGTQLVAKGHNFPRLTLVGVIDADLGLQGADLRAAERSFQMMRQVSGRAGRGGRPGLALMQTFQPDHPVIRAILSGDEEGFWHAEATERRAAAMPPFGRMAGIIISAPGATAAFDLGTHLARTDGPLRRVGATVFGPAPAPVARIRGRHRVRLLVKAPRGAALQQAIAQWIGGVKLTSGLRLAVDIDPQSFY